MRDATQNEIAVPLPGIQKTRFRDVISTAMRKRRDVGLRKLIRAVFLERGRVSILDLGGSVSYWHRVGCDFLNGHGVSLTLLNNTPSEFHANSVGTPPDDLRMVVGDACDLSAFPDDAFEIVHSNSVIEHVGDWSRMRAFAREARRVGVRHYVQTPYFWFPIDPHFYGAPLFHWMPRQVRADILRTWPVATCGKIGPLDDAYRVVDGSQLLDKRQMRTLFPDSRLVMEKVAGVTKSLIAIG